MTTTSTTFENKIELISFYSDYYKDAYGIRPRHIDFTSWTKENFDKEFDRLEKIIEADLANEKILQDEQEVKFETLIESTIASGAGNRKTALRWIFEGGEGNLHGVDYFLYSTGLSYDSKIRKEILGLFE